MDITKNKSCIHYLIGVLLFYVIFQVVTQPWVLQGEMWAEMATNYFVNAHSPSFFDKFFSTDAGYLIFPQRIIAFLGIPLSASLTAFYYTWSAIILTGLLVGVFCLSRFRNIIQNDFLRFATCLLILTVVDFETRTFINFTYFGAFFAAIITALALAEKSEEVPVWAWFIPLLIVSKPSLLAIMPAMLVTAFIRKGRFRHITALTLLLAIAQLIQVTTSFHHGVMESQVKHISVYLEVVASIKYFFGLLASYFIGPLFLKKYPLTPMMMIITGIIIFTWTILSIIKASSKSNTLILIGFSLLFFNVFLNCFALNATWNHSLTQLPGPPLYRHIIVGFFGFVLTLSGIISKLNIKKPDKNQALIFIVLALLSGWIFTGIKISKIPRPPVSNNSHWQALASSIDNNEETLCVPVDPLGWMYGKNCMALNPSLNGGIKPDYKQATSFTIIPQKSIQGKTIASFGILVKASNNHDDLTKSKAILMSSDGNIYEFSGAEQLSKNGKLFLFKGLHGVKNVTTISISFDEAVEVGFLQENNDKNPMVLWMGY